MINPLKYFADKKADKVRLQQINESMSRLQLMEVRLIYLGLGLKQNIKNEWLMKDYLKVRDLCYELKAKPI